LRHRESRDSECDDHKNSTDVEDRRCQSVYPGKVGGYETDINRAKSTEKIVRSYTSANYSDKSELRSGARGIQEYGNVINRP